MIVRTCLLISDDPDDHIEFSEALYDISDNTILITVSDARKAVDLLTLKKCIPEFIVLDLAMADFNPNAFFDVLDDDPLLRDVKVIVYGGSEPPNSQRVVAFLDDDPGYSNLKAVLKKVIVG